MKILIVEDEIRVASFIKKGLEDYGMEADIALHADSAQKMLTLSGYDVLILDINLPRISGIELCKKLRQQNNHIPVLMLTALGTTEDKLSGFDAGADDYLVKPFEFLELMARVRALGKRNQQQSPNAAFQPQLLKIADLELNLTDKSVRRNQQKIDLTARELMLLEFFIRNKGRAVSRAEIAEKVWDLSFDTGTNVVDVYVNFLRKKIDRNFSPKLIHTLIGIGYIMREGED